MKVINSGIVFIYVSFYLEHVEKLVFHVLLKNNLKTRIYSGPALHNQSVQQEEHGA